MSADFLPIRPLPQSPGGNPSPAAGADANAAGRTTGGGKTGGARSADALRAARAAREFQALFLMELMKPMTEALSSNPLSSEEGEGNGNPYSWFWSEGLAGHLAGALPLPSPGSAVPPDGAAVGAGPIDLLRALSSGGLPTRSSGAIPFPAPAPFDLLKHPSPGIELRSSPRVPEATSPAARTHRSGDHAAGASGGAKLDPLSEAAPSSPPPPLSTAAAADALSSPGSAPKPVTQHETLLARAGQLFQLPVNLLRAVMMVESGGNEDAVSPQGAVGLMQLMPETAEEMGIRNPRDPWENLYAGAKYLSRQVARFDSLEKAVAAYNAGPSAVESHGGVPPFHETQTYVRRVLETKARLDLLRPQDA